jgi:hypothetical protein
MTPEYLVYLGIVGLILVMFAAPIWTAVKTAIVKLWPASGESTAVNVADSVIGNASKYSQYAVAHGALYTLRLCDFENPNLDISAEITAIDAKLASAVKSGNLTPPAA